MPKTPRIKKEKKEQVEEQVKDQVVEQTEKQVENLNNLILEDTDVKNTYGEVIVGGKKLSKKIVFGTVVLVIVLLLAGYYFYNQSKKEKQNLNLANIITVTEKEAEARKEAEVLVLIVGKLVELPKNEIPTVATIVDKEKLKDQQFFKTVENGDKLLVYTKALKAILYRPSTNKVIDMTVLSLGEKNGEQEVKQNLAVSVGNVKVAYYNGSSIAGLAGSAEKIVKGKFANFKTVALSNASKADYKETIVVDISGKYSKEVAEIAKLLNSKVELMPKGEVAPLADILVISGK